MVEEPKKELRFTRSGQAVMFCVVGAVFVGMAVTILATGIYREINPELPSPYWAVPCIAIAFGAFWLARHLTKHAFLILTPLGLEIFPFYRPSKGLQVIMWQEIAAAEVKGKWLTLHFNKEKTSGMHISMGPVRRKIRDLLAKAVLGRVSGGNK